MLLYQTTFALSYNSRNRYYARMLSVADVLKYVHTLAQCQQQSLHATWLMIHIGFDLFTITKSNVLLAFFRERMRHRESSRGRDIAVNE